MVGPRVPTVEVVIINYKRQASVESILRRFREQSHPCTITLVDQGGGLASATYDLAHRVYTLSDNFGPWNRFVPVGNYHCDYTYFHDDDMLPGRDIVKHFVTHAENTPDGALFGQCGRMCTDGYNPTDPELAGYPVPTSLVIRGYFVRSRYLWALVKFARYFAHPVTEDDIFLAWSIYTYTDKLIYATPTSGKPSELMNETELPAPAACCERPGHRQVRDRFWRECEKICQEIREAEGRVLEKVDFFRESSGKGVTSPV